jgi:hypothetical protein
LAAIEIFTRLHQCVLCFVTLSPSFVRRASSPALKPLSSPHPSPCGRPIVRGEAFDLFSSEATRECSMLTRDFFLCALLLLIFLQPSWTDPRLTLGSCFPRYFLLLHHRQSSSSSLSSSSGSRPIIVILLDVYTSLPPSAFVSILTPPPVAFARA